MRRLFTPKLPANITGMTTLSKSKFKKKYPLPEDTSNLLIYGRKV
jgi:hypothetical protein